MVFCNSCGADGVGNFCRECGRPAKGVAPRPDVDFAVWDAKATGHSDQRKEVLFEGTTWPLWCFSPMCCKVRYWTINRKRVDWEHGYCRNKADTIDLRRIRDIALRTNIFQRMVGRGSIYIYASAQLSGKVTKLSKFGARNLYKDLRAAWTECKMGTAADDFDDDDVGTVAS